MELVFKVPGRNILKRKTPGKRKRLDAMGGKSAVADGASADEADDSSRPRGNKEERNLRRLMGKRQETLTRKQDKSEHTKQLPGQIEAERRSGQRKTVRGGLREEVGNLE